MQEERDDEVESICERNLFDGVFDRLVWCISFCGVLLLKKCSRYGKFPRRVIADQTCAATKEESTS